MRARIVQRKADELAGTPKGFRRFETLCIFAFPVLAVTLVWRLRGAAMAWPPLVPLAGLIGFLAADFISGVMHWVFDSWGSLETPIVGRTLIRTFREHHVDQKAITRHDFIETNGSNAFGGCSLLVTALFLLGDSDSARTQSGAWSLLDASLLFVGFFIAMTSQIHKWAHVDRPPTVIAWLQRWRLMLSPEHHATHHDAPFDRAYCITNGWLNQTLGWTRFFPFCERMISAITGALPRHDDIGTEAALAVAVDDQLATPPTRTVDPARTAD